MADKQKLVTGTKEDGYTFTCPYSTGCGVPGGASFTSSGWANRGHAVARGKQHIREHETQEVSQELQDFRVAQGVTAATAGVNPADWEF